MLPLLAALLLLVPTRPVEIVRLHDGTLVHGEIVAFDEAAGFTLRRADTGGVLELRWEHLPPDEVQRIRVSRGFTGEDPAPYLVDVMHLILKNGTTESGVRVDDPPPDVIRLRRRSGVADFPRSFVRSVEAGRMEGLEIFSADELYQVLMAEHGTPDDALSHFKLAVACEGAGLYAQAKEHYASAQQVDRDLKRDLIEVRLTRIDIKLEDAAETAVLDEIRSRLRRSKFGDALGMLAEFRRDYPDSRQLLEADTLERDVLQSKRDHYARRIVSDYFSLMNKRIGDIGRNRDIGLDLARRMAEDVVHSEILATLAASYEMTVEDVDQLWEARRGASRRGDDYGTGTFILGEAAALRFGRFATGEVEESAEPGAAAVQEETFADTIERMRQEQAERSEQRRAGGRGSVLDEVGDTPDEWWDKAATDVRIDWVTAYFAEFGGGVELLEATPRPCRQCDAYGFVSTTNERGEIVRLTCPVCKNLRYERLVRFR